MQLLTRRMLAPLMICATAHAALAAATGTIHDAERGFSFAVPAGYAEYPEGRAPGVLHSFARGRLGDPSFAVLRVQALGGTIDRAPLVRETVERAARNSVGGTGVELVGFDYRKMKWNAFDLEVVVTQAVNGDRKVVTLGTQVPLAKEAIQLYFMGPATDEAKLVDDLQTTLGSLEGRSNWLTDDERDERLGRAVGMVVGAVGGLALVWWWRRRRARS
jgi:hypothetical protein